MTRLPAANLLQKIQADPLRPRYHFCAPAGWMNDPNGTIYHQGYYHVFYQWNPYGDQWGSIHWGHARSRDLLTWEHLPVTLTPTAELGEEHCFSGCLVLRENAPPLILYTAIGPQMEIKHTPQQWAAVGDEDLITWHKHPHNPLLTTAHHNGLTVWDWRDPFVFTAAERNFLVLGGKLRPEDGGAAVVLLYEAQDPTLETWVYRGILFRHPDLNRVSVECANLFQVGQHWVMLLATHQRVEYYVGVFDPDAGTFTPHATGLLDGSDQFYATNLLRDAQQRVICFGWLRGFVPNRGWNGCLALPRVLSLNAQNQLQQAPIPELAQLHGASMHVSNIALGTYALPNFQSAALDLHVILQCDPQAIVGVKLFPTDPAESPIVLSCAPTETHLNHQLLPFARANAVDIRLFVDQTVVEVFINSQACLTWVRPTASPCHLELFAETAPATLQQLEVWEMSPIRNEKTLSV